MEKVKIFLCKGCEIAQKIDLEKLKKHFNSNAQVESIEILTTLCDGAAREHLAGVEGALLFGACDERTHGVIFRELAGSNPYQLVNLRERCAWVHDDQTEATAKAQRLLSMGLAELSTRPPDQAEWDLDLLHRVLVIGAGPAGLACVRALAEQGCDVTLIEKTNRLGGTLRRTRTVWPSGEDSEKLLHRLYNELQDELHVTVYQQTELVELTESLHGYRVKLSNDVEEEVGAIVVATGIREVGGNLFEFEYRWRDRGDFRGPLAFEVKEDVHPFLLETALWDAVMLRHEKPEERIVFFVPESVVLPEGFKEGAEKHNIEIIRGSIPGGVTGVTGVMSLRPERKLRVIVKMPRRGTGVRGVTGVTGWRGAVVKLGKLVGNLPQELAQALRIPMDKDGYLVQRRFRIRPRDVVHPGIFVVGGAHAPMPMEETINHAFVVAARIKAMFNAKSKRLPAAQIDEEACIGCGYCAAVCPYGAPILERTDTGHKARISPRFCTLCGLCIAGCPVFAIFDPIKSRKTIRAQIESWGNS
ncbi:CoB--CoM heterodisulfide reductase iron-sulfur subunit A family protein [candidate division WOR-3 bacterium]|nr:CoB--CoM heterodisulfide reductase iron-sulfur subunit A family protein [candidate division WOR-3 bacterium]